MKWENNTSFLHSNHRQFHGLNGIWDRCTPMTKERTIPMRWSFNFTLMGAQKIKGHVYGVHLFLSAAGAQFVASSESAGCWLPAIQINDVLIKNHRVDELWTSFSKTPFRMGSLHDDKWNQKGWKKTRFWCNFSIPCWRRIERSERGKSSSWIFLGAEQSKRALIWLAGFPVELICILSCQKQSDSGQGDSHQFTLFMS